MAKVLGEFLGALMVLCGAIALIVALSAIFALPVMWLVNYLFTGSVLIALFGTAQIGFFKAWGLSILMGLLFKTVRSK